MTEASRTPPPVPSTPPLVRPPPVPNSTPPQIPTSIPRSRPEFPFDKELYMNSNQKENPTNPNLDKERLIEEARRKLHQAELEMAAMKEKKETELPRASKTKSMKGERGLWNKLVSKFTGEEGDVEGVRPVDIGTPENVKHEGSWK
jgi:hypothetical protein